jgi:hypothetical protein
MKTERCGNYADGQFQGLTASKFLPQLTQAEFLLGGWYAETPPETDAGVRAGNSIGSLATEIDFVTPMNSRERG